MSYFMHGMNALTGATFSGLMRTDESWYVRAGRRDMSHTRRGESQFGSRFAWYTLWPTSGFMSGDRSEGYAQIGQDCCETDWWSPWQRANRGNGATKFIMGQCKDSNGNALGGVTVQGFLTATDTYIGEIATDDKGNYELPTQYASPTTHYLVAYRTGSPDLTGATVNTLTATNRDGTP